MQTTFKKTLGILPFPQIGIKTYITGMRQLTSIMELNENDKMKQIYCIMVAIMSSTYFIPYNENNFLNSPWVIRLLYHKRLILMMVITQ